MKLHLTTAMVCATVALPAAGLAQSAESPSGPDGCVAVFTISDTDGDGIISRQEYEAWQTASFAALDADGSGALSRQEYVDCLSTAYSAANLQVSDNRDMDTLTVVDVDESGALSPNEYMVATQAAHADAQAGDDEGLMLLRRLILLPPDMSDGALGDMSPNDVASQAAMQFRTLDVDEDGTLTGDEWSAQQVTSRDAKPWLDTDFDAMDKNDDGTLTQSEFMDYGHARWSKAETAAMAQGATPANAPANGEASGGATAQGSGDPDSAGMDGEERQTDAPTVYFYYFDPALFR